MESKSLRRYFIALMLSVTLLLAGTVPMFADDDDIEFVLRVKPGTLSQVLAQFQLEVEESIAGQDVYLVERSDDNIVASDTVGGDDDDDGDDDDGNGDDGNDDDDDNSNGDDDSSNGGSGSGTGSTGSSGTSGSSTSDIDDLTLAQFIAAVRANPNVISFEINEDVDLPEDDDARVAPQVSTAPFDPLLADRTLNNYYGDTVWTGYVQQPANAMLGLTQTHTAKATGTGVVAVIDTGVDPDHPALRNALVPGFDFTTGVAGSATEMNEVAPAVSGLLQQSTVAFLDGVPISLDQRFTIIVRQSTVAFLDGSQLPSSFGHGTMVAGVIRLAAPNARIMPLKAFRADGKSNLFHLMKAVYYAADNGAKVINMSFSLPQESRELSRAITYATSRNIVCVASVGNQGLQSAVYPARLANVIGVASVSNSGQRSSFSNYGSPMVTLAAPGEGILTPFPGGGYAAAWGTSFAAPFVAATVALMVQDQPGLTQQQADAAVRKATPLSPELGAGLLNVAKALDLEISGASPVVSEATPESSTAGQATSRCRPQSRIGRLDSGCVIRSIRR